MNISQNMKDAVARRDFDAIRRCLRAQIAMDLNFASGACDENLDYLRRELGGEHEKIFQPNKELSQGNLEISEASLAKLLGELSNNFSEERLNKMRQMAAELRRKDEREAARKSAVPESDSAAASSERPESGGYREKIRTERVQPAASSGGSGSGGSYYQTDPKTGEKIRYERVESKQRSFGRIVTGAAIGAVVVGTVATVAASSPALAAIAGGVVGGAAAAMTDPGKTKQ